MNTSTTCDISFKTFSQILEKISNESSRLKIIEILIKLFYNNIKIKNH